MRIVLVKVGACVLERKNLMASPFTSPLKTLHWGGKRQNGDTGKC